MKRLSILLLFFLSQQAFSQVLLDADGPGDTYDLIISVLAPNYNPIEVPDCSHPDFGDHIDEVFDTELNDHVFRFHMHTSPDDDRCINFDRQRNEIKSYDKSPDNLLGVENELVVYKWKFKLPEGFQSSPNFTHIHQLKSVGGSLASMPMYTLTTRKGSPDRLELRYSETDSQVTLIQKDLAPFIGTWLEVTETIEYGSSGTYEIEIKRLDDDTVLLTYENLSIVNWRPGGEFVRPKWGIYRSLNNAQDLRDEMVLFANFSVEEIESVSSTELIATHPPIVFSNPVSRILHLENLSKQINRIQIFSLDGKIILNKTIEGQESIDIDVSTFSNGTYILHLEGDDFNQAKQFLVFKE